MALYLIGLGLADASDITLKGIELAKKADTVYMENYTSILQYTKEELEQLLQKKIIQASREVMENNNKIIREAKQKNIAILVPGDPLVATTHVELLLEAKKTGIETHIVHNASIVNAIGCTGLQVYKFGRTISIPFQQDATTFFDMIIENKKAGMHTLLLLDLDTSTGKFLPIPEALERIEQIEKKKKKVLGKNVIGCARIGAKDQQIAAGTSEKLKKINWGKPPYCIVIPGKLHFMEEESLKLLS